ncbi:ABC transporter ATP-binding protein [Kibdelosporangium phytohabitans]|uniref:ABC transporter ATP-binding protein n=1 Tax=Kibdelosporangium phytohabitans TaxID=860235 RepID=UPI0019D85F07|nr:ABC transporter ATP-binding protein [Kibdelosporangium phytohabitans]MBE1471498.1 ABC-2 type transport system ATP-binding protein [Kibdelosporangium phytohabitans]
MKEHGAAVSITGLTKNYGDLRAVDAIDVLIAPGEVVALLGPNGAGKSTTVDMILGLAEPDAGQVLVFGNTPREAVAEGAIGAMLQNGTLLDDATVEETVAMIASLHREPMPVAEAMRRAGVQELANRRCTKLSGGQRQRVRFAVALVANPDLLVLDEPTAAMDVGTRREFWASMREFTDQGRTVLFATHYLDEAEEFADRVILMRAGKIVADGSVASVREMASGRTIAAVLPDVPVELLECMPGVAAAERRADRIQLTCKDSDAALRALLHYPDVRDIEVSAAGLEEAFLALTAQENAR